jgi:hypothetical protein
VVAEYLLKYAEPGSSYGSLRNQMGIVRRHSGIRRIIPPRLAAVIDPWVYAVRFGRAPTTLCRMARFLANPSGVLQFAEYGADDVVTSQAGPPLLLEFPHREPYAESAGPNLVAESGGNVTRRALVVNALGMCL